MQPLALSQSAMGQRLLARAWHSSQRHSSLLCLLAPVLPAAAQHSMPAQRQRESAAAAAARCPGMGRRCSPPLREYPALAACRAPPCVEQASQQQVARGPPSAGGWPTLLKRTVCECCRSPAPASRLCRGRARRVLEHLAGVAVRRANPPRPRAAPAPPPLPALPSGLAPELPEDLYHLIKKAVAMRKHLEANRKDKDGERRLWAAVAVQLVASRLVPELTVVQQLAQQQKRHVCAVALWKLPTSTMCTSSAPRRPSAAHPALPNTSCLTLAGKFHLILVESRIHRLARYYKRTKKLPPNWK